VSHLCFDLFFAGVPQHSQVESRRRPAVPMKLNLGALGEAVCNGRVDPYYDP
jgi:hypothetical protein